MQNMDHEISNAVPDVLKRLLLRFYVILKLGAKSRNFHLYGAFPCKYKERRQKDENFEILPPTSR